MHLDEATGYFPTSLRSWLDALVAVDDDQPHSPLRRIKTAKERGRTGRAAIIGIAALAALLGLGTHEGGRAQTPTLDNPIVFVTQVPVPPDYGEPKIGATFGNHSPDAGSVGRGGDLWIRYSDGTIKNLTAAAGYGTEGPQGRDSIAVRDPTVHWDGAKVIFSMVVGVDTNRGGLRWPLGRTSVWQIYEITGLGREERPEIHKVPGQPTNYNNLTPAYTSDDRVVFTSDRPRDGEAHLYPLLEEYNMAPTVTGIWSLAPRSGELRMLTHNPSGAFTPSVDSFGRIIFTQWDHLQRDQNADVGFPGCLGAKNFERLVDWHDETPGAAPLDEPTQWFPEPRPCRKDLLAGTGLRGHEMSHYFPWQMRQNGRGVETLNHIGRQELAESVQRARLDDPDLVDYDALTPRGQANRNPMRNMFQVREDPTRPGHYIGTRALHSWGQSAGQIVSLEGNPKLSADEMRVTYITHPDTAEATEDPGSGHSGLYRDAIRTLARVYVVAHTNATGDDANEGTAERPRARHDYRLKTLVPTGDGYYAAGPALTRGIVETVSYPGGPIWARTHVEYDGPLWELQPVELVPRERPGAELPELLQEDGWPLAQQTGTDTVALERFLVDNELAMLVSRNVTVRDDADRQQPFNLRVPGGVESTGTDGTSYDVAYLQIFQADRLRSLMWIEDDGTEVVMEGRRVLARPLHDPAAMEANGETPRGGPEGSVAIAFDGSAAAFVPAGRALSWQLTTPAGAPVVRERYWLTFQPGEIRVCGSCHAVNEQDQQGRPKRRQPAQLPIALLDLLEGWRRQGL